MIFSNNDEKNSMGYIYILLYKDIPFYVGQSITPKKRFTKHRYDCFTKVKQLPLYQYMRKITNYDQYEKDIEMRIVLLCDKSELNMREKEYIREYMTKGFKLYNNCLYSYTLSKFINT